MTLKERAEKFGLNPDDFDDEETLRKEVEEKEKEEEEKEEEGDPTEKDLDYWKKEAEKAFSSRDSVKKERNKLRDKIKELENSVNDSPSKTEFDGIKEELKTYKEFKETVEKEREEEELKNKSELERFKVETEKEMEALRNKMNQRIEETSKTVEQKEKEIEGKEKEILDLRNIRLNKEILEAATKHSAYNPSQIVNLVKEQFSYIDDLNEFSNEVRDEKGKLIDSLNVEETVEKFLKDPTNENLVKSTVPPGGGSDTNQDDTHSQFDKNKREKFGKYDPDDPKLKADADLKGLDVETHIDILQKRDAKLSRAKSETE